MDRKLAGIDHLIIGVRDLEATRQRYARLGFNSTPRGRHVGWGTANYCIMFEHDYLELLGIIDPTQFTNRLDEFLAHREGLLSIALASRDIDGTHAAWTEAGLDPSAPRALARLLEAGAASTELRFRNVMLPRERTAGVNIFALEHLTPEQLRQPAWLAHPNGARTIRSCTIVAADPEPVVTAMTKVFGSAAVTDTDNIVAVHAGWGVILIAPPEDAELIHPLAEVPDHIDEPLLLALTIGVADPERAASFLRLQGVAFRRSPFGDVLIPPSETHGVVLELTRA